MINLQPAALEELRRLLKQQTTLPRQVRLSLQAGGCADWTYCLSPVGLEPSPGVDEISLRWGEFDLVVPTAALPQIEGLTIDYAEDLMGGGFRFINPQAVYSCGCGNSFSTVASEPRTDCSGVSSASS
ncbi:MAG: iron-sulfur cluster assembly accessory protein [Cyanobacteria bacterium REEB459]|nr:iron-sulfur cluster assembly accessory protein [Cyanobacteria bacterium REEB459]